MAKGSARQRKKIAKRLRLQSVQMFMQGIEKVLSPKIVQPPAPKILRIPAPKEEEPATLHRVTKTNFKKKKNKKLNRKQRKRIKLQQRRQNVQYRDSAQRQYYEQHADKEYTDEVLDMTQEYAENIVMDILRLEVEYQRNALLNIFYDNYNEKGDAYIKQLHDTEADNKIREAVEVAIASYKGFMPDSWFNKCARWLSVGVPIEARNTGVDVDTDDISSDMYE